MLVALVAIQAAALSIYVFEWFSPVGHNMKVAEYKLHTLQCNVARLSGPACGAITIPVWHNGQNYVTFFSRN